MCVRPVIFTACMQSKANDRGAGGRGRASREATHEAGHGRHTISAGLWAVVDALHLHPLSHPAAAREHVPEMHHVHSPEVSLGPRGDHSTATHTTDSCNKPHRITVTRFQLILLIIQKTGFMLKIASYFYSSCRTALENPNSVSYLGC